MMPKDRQQIFPDIITMIKDYIPDDMPLAKTDQIGHGPDSRGIVIGKKLLLSKGK